MPSPFVFHPPPPCTQKAGIFSGKGRDAAVLARPGRGHGALVHGRGIGWPGPRGREECASPRAVDVATRARPPDVAMGRHGSMFRSKWQRRYPRSSVQREQASARRASLPPLAVAAPRSPAAPALILTTTRTSCFPQTPSPPLRREPHAIGEACAPAAAKLFNRPVDSSYISLSDDCDELPRGFTGRL